MVGWKKLRCGPKVCSNPAVLKLHIATSQDLRAATEENGIPRWPGLRAKTGLEKPLHLGLGWPDGGLIRTVGRVLTHSLSIWPGLLAIGYLDLRRIILCVCVSVCVWCVCVFMCVCACVCVHVSVCVKEHVHMQATYPQLSILPGQPTHMKFWDSISHQDMIRQAKPICLSLSFQSWGYKNMPPCPGPYIRTGVLNAHPYTCTARLYH